MLQTSAWGLMRKMTNQHDRLATYQSRNGMSEPEIPDKIKKRLRIKTIRRDSEGTSLCASGLAKRYVGARLDD